MSKEKRFVIQVDPLEIEDDAIYDNKELKLYECQSDMMSDICSLLNKQDQQIAELQKQLTITEKALELGVGLIFEEYGCSKFDDKTCNKGDKGKVCYQCIKDEYLIRAKEMLENE